MRGRARRMWIPVKKDEPVEALCFSSGETAGPAESRAKAKRHVLPECISLSISIDVLEAIDNEIARFLQIGYKPIGTRALGVLVGEGLYRWAVFRKLFSFLGFYLSLGLRAAWR
jgi:hypothetical protein